MSGSQIICQMFAVGQGLRSKIPHELNSLHDLHVCSPYENRRLELKGVTGVERRQLCALTKVTVGLILSLYPFIIKLLRDSGIDDRRQYDCAS